MANDKNYPLSFHSEQAIPSQTSCSCPSSSCCLCFCSEDLKVFLALGHGVLKQSQVGAAVFRIQPVAPPRLL